MRLTFHFMRIEGGEARGRPLQAPRGETTRPTDGRTREMLFNSLGERVVGARVLDCYAGSGAVGLEALSRGASWCVFIENDHSALKALRANLKALGYENRAQVWNANVRTSLEKLVEDGRRFDIVFADPPFSHPTETREFCKRIDTAALLLNNVSIGTGTSPEDFARLNSAQSSPGLLVLQHHRKAEPEPMAHFEPRREKRAGESMLSFFEYRDAVPNEENETEPGLTTEINDTA